MSRLTQKGRSLIERDRNRTNINLSSESFNIFDKIPNLLNDFFLDVAEELPSIPNNNNSSSNGYNTQTSQISEATTTDYESAHSRLSSIDSLLSGGGANGESVNFDQHSPIELPDCSSPTLPSRSGTAEEDDDDVWMNQFGKDPLKKSLSVSGNVEIIPSLDGTAGPPAVKRQTTTSGRLETTTYSFSIGNTESTGDGIVDGESQLEEQTGSEPWVKRDSKERQPVRKHLKAVNVKATVNVTPEHHQSTSPDTSKTPVENMRSVDSGINDPINALSNQRHSSTASSDSEKDAGGVSVNVNQATSATSQQNGSKLQDITENLEPRSNSLSLKQGPVTLPKPKKPLDKKSWTADLIKSKTQKIPDQPQPGSLNEKLLQQGVKKSENTTELTADLNGSQQRQGLKKIGSVDILGQGEPANHLQQRSASVGQRSNVRDIRNKFQHNTVTVEETAIGASELSSSAPTVEKYV